MKERRAIYVGEDFPEYKGKEIAVRNYNSNPKVPSYSIKFDGEDYWHDDFDDEDIEFIS